MPAHLAVGLTGARNTSFSKLDAWRDRDIGGAALIDGRRRTCQNNRGKLMSCIVIREGDTLATASQRLTARLAREVKPLRQLDNPCQK